MGTFHAYHAAGLGKKVLLIEKDQYPVQATVRNFGQVVPSGMSADWFEYGVYSTQLYKEIQDHYDISIRQNGSVYLASDADEQSLLHELKAVMDDREYEARLLSQKQCLERWPALKASYCREGIFFPQEVSAEPPFMIHRLIEYCKVLFPKLTYKPSTTVIDCLVAGDEVRVVTHKSDVFVAAKVIICNGGEFKILFPDLFSESGIEMVGPLAVRSVVEAIAQSVQRTFGRPIELTVEPGADGAAVDWTLPEAESIPIALTLNELLTNAIKHSRSDRAVSCRLVGEAEGVRLEIGNEGLLPPDFRIENPPATVSGLGLVRALLPRRHASLGISQRGARVVAVVSLAAPVVARARPSAAATATAALAG